MSDTSSSSENGFALKMAGLGAVAAVVLSPLAAAIVAVVYRFPVPLSGYARGFGEAGSAALGSLLYLVFGGVLVVGILGAAGGFVAARSASDVRRVRRRTVAAAAAVALLAAITMAVLEFFIGPW
ncbi:hypothetical protein ACQPW1_27630 [Nocardia sp. CA-128927]|uniref:hypothetical protein n=1 Tax=Nocardia sp. CA-128927 TaxID=3239975 RepID=UPI003D9615FD